MEYFVAGNHSILLVAFLNIFPRNDVVYFVEDSRIIRMYFDWKQRDNQLIALQLLPLAIRVLNP